MEGSRMKSALIVLTLAAGIAPSLRAEVPADAQERYKMKYGRLHPAAEERLRIQQEKSGAGAPTLAKELDRNGDGIVSVEEVTEIKTLNERSCACRCAGSES
jgi:hypothetical protein